MTMPKPYHPVKVSSQRCDQCGVVLVHGDPAVAHMYNPIVFCMACAGAKEPSHPSLVKAVIHDPKE
jgi:hypothetical protein